MWCKTKENIKMEQETWKEIRLNNTKTLYEILIKEDVEEQTNYIGKQEVF